MDIALDSLLWWTLKGSVILLLAFAATLLLRRRPAAVRHAIWTVALAGQLLLPFGGSLLPERTLELNVPMAVMAPPPVTQPIAAPATPVTASPQPAGTFNFLLLIPIGAALLLLRLAAGTLQVLWLARRSSRVVDADWLILLQQQCDALHIARPVTLIRTDRVPLPVTWGFVYPTILLPGAAAEWPAALRRHVLLHELAHVKRGDALTQLVSQLVMALFWFNPLVWLAVRRMRAEAENACDDYVLRDGERPSVYATSLFELVRAHEHVALPAFASLSVGTRSELETRVGAITHPRRDWSVRRASLGFAVAAMIVVVVPLSAVQRAIATVAPVVPAIDDKPRAVASKIDCRPLRKLGFEFQQISGTGTDDDGTVTHYFFLRPEADRCIEASFPGDTRFTGDDRDVVLAPGLTAYVREKRGDTDRVAYLSGSGERRFVLNGKPAPWSAGSGWYREIMPEYIRRSAAGIADRARRIVERDGVEGLIAELGRIPDTSNRRMYLEALLTFNDLPRERAIEIATESLRGYEPDLATFLAGLVTREGSLLHVRAIVLEAVGFLENASNRNTVLEAMARHPDAEVRRAVIENVELLPKGEWRRSLLEKIR